MRPCSCYGSRKFRPQEWNCNDSRCQQKVITVGASDDGEQKDRFGKVGDELLRQRTDIRVRLQAGSGGPRILYPFLQRIRTEKESEDVFGKSGTSMSAPIVSGAAALLLSKYPDMKNVEVKLRLLMSADDMGKDANIQGRGLLNIEKLLNPKL